MPASSTDHKLAAILTAAAADYETFAEPDAGPASVIRANHLEGMAMLVRQHHGRVLTASEKLHADFPDAVDAVRCALEIQATVFEHNAKEDEERRLWFRLGVHRGEVPASAEDIPRAALEVVNALGRLAEPGGIGLSHSIHDRVENTVDVPFEDLGLVELEGLAGRVRVYRVAPREEKQPPRGLVSALRVAAAVTLITVLGIVGTWILFVSLVTQLEDKGIDTGPVGEALGVHDEPGMGPIRRERQARSGAPTSELQRTLYASQPLSTALPVPGGRLTPRATYGVAGRLAHGRIAAGYGHAVVTSPQTRRLSVSVPAGQVLVDIDGLASPLALSPSGNELVYVAEVAGRRALYRESMTAGRPTRLVGTDGAQTPFFAPDGRSVGFWAQGELRHISLGTGAVSRIATLTEIRGASWGSDDQIVYADLDSGLWRVGVGGGAPERLSHVDPEAGEIGHLWPQILPGGTRVLFSNWTRTGVHLTVLSLETGQRKALFPVGAGATLLPSGYLVYAEQGFLLALPIDPETLAPRGPRTPVLDGVYTSARGAAYFALAQAGLLAYVPDPTAWAERALVWVDRRGESVPITRGAAYEFPRLSPQGERVTYARHTPEGRHDVWVYNLAHAVGLALTESGNNLQPAWAPGGDKITFALASGGGVNLHSISADGTEAAEPLLIRDRHQLPGLWSLDGSLLAFSEFDPDVGLDIWALRAQGSVAPVLRTKSSESAPVVSPDGEWLAYVSDETGRDEVYLRSFGGRGEPQQISSDGGREPLWSRSGDELFYRHANQMLAVPMLANGSVEPGSPRVLFERTLTRSPSVRAANYDVASDGRFLMIEPLDVDPAPSRIDVVVDWSHDLALRFDPASVPERGPLR